MNTFALALSLCLPLAEPEVSPADLARLPDYAYTDWAYDRNRECRQGVVDWVATLPSWHREEGFARLAEHDARFLVWEELFLAHWANRYGPTRDNGSDGDIICYHLRELRRLIGPVNYRLGIMPAPLPPATRRID